MALVAFLLIIIGLLNIFARDLVWTVTSWSHGQEGVVAKRTPAWEGGRIVAGIAIAALGAFLMVRQYNDANPAPPTPAPVAGPLTPYPGAVAYQAESDPAVERLITEQNLPSGDLAEIEWYRVRANLGISRSQLNIMSFYSDQLNAPTCSTSHAIVRCEGPGGMLRYRTVALSDDELLLGVY